MQNQNEPSVDNNHLQQQTDTSAPADYGYLNGSYTMGVDDPQTLQDKADAEAAASSSSVSSEELASIASKLGVDVNALAGLLGVGLPEVVAEETLPETQEPKKEEEKEEPEDEIKRLNSFWV